MLADGMILATIDRNFQDHTILSAIQFHTPRSYFTN